MNIQGLDQLRDQLLKEKEWPISYMFKFITPNVDGKVDQIKQLLPSQSKISFNHTPNLKYVSVTCVASMASAEDIISVTTKVLEIQGVMAL
jgi:hypothetical protein